MLQRPAGTNSSSRLSAHSNRDVEAGLGLRLRSCSPARNSIHENSDRWVSAASPSQPSAATVPASALAPFRCTPTSTVSGSISANFQPSSVQRQLFLPVDDNYSCRFTFCALRCCATLVR